MKVHVQAKNLELTDALAAAVTKRLEQLGRRYAFLHEGYVVVDKQRGWFTAELTLHVRHQILRSEERANDLAAAIDEAFEKSERQLTRHKGRLQHRSRAGEHKEAPPLTDFEAAEPEEEYTAPRVVRVKKISIKPMSVEEAALQMELLGHDFYVFTNGESDELNVVYQRKNGDVGLIQPE